MNVSDATPVSTSELPSADGHGNDPSAPVRTRSDVRVSWHAAICVALGCAFVVTGAARVLEALRVAPIPISSYHTTDYFLTQLLGTPGGSERLVHVFSVLPAKAPVAVVIPDGNWSADFTAYILTYFGWPREVRLIAVNSENAKSRLDALDRASLAAIFFCSVNPPARMQPGIRLGKELVIVPAENTQ